MPTYPYLPLRKPRSSLGGWWVWGLVVGGVASAVAIILYRLRYGLKVAESALEESSTAPAVPDRIAVTEEWMAGGKGMDTLVPSAYAVPDSAAALYPDAAFDVHPSMDAPPVASAYSDPAPSAGSPAEPMPESAHAAVGEAGVAQGEPWMNALRLAMEKEPVELGYDRSAWTAPLLGRYLVDTQGVSVPLPRLRSAIKDLGYQWHHTHYVRVHPGMG